MAKLTMAQRKRMPSSSFALPGKGEGPSGKGAGSYPIGDIKHARNALARVSQHGTPAEKATVRAKVHRRYPGIGKKQYGGMIAPTVPTARPRTPRTPKLGAPPLIGARPIAAKPIVPRISSGRLSSAAGMRGGGTVAGVHYGAEVSSPKKPHTYEHGGVVDRIGREALTGKRTMSPMMKSNSGDQSPAACGSMKGHGTWASLGIHKSK